MTTADLSVLALDPYTWLGLADKDWTDPEATKTWDGAAVYSYRMAVGETAQTAEQASRDMTTAQAEALASTDGDAIVRSMTMAHLREVGVGESYVDNIDFMIRAMEAFGVTDAHTKSIGVGAFDLVGVTETGFSKNIAMSIADATALTEVFGRTVAFCRAYAEASNMAEAVGKATQISKKEAFASFDEYLRHGNAVLSDMILLDKEITFEGFKEILDAGNSPGYAPFRDFIPGDYDYQFALFRAVLESSNSDRARISELRVDVDVPDVIETGSCQIVDAEAGLRVNFTRLFHIVPEITLNLRGGTVIAIPDLDASDETGFTVYLRDLENNRVPGKVTWAAHGY